MRKDPTLHREVVTNHNTYSHTTEYGRATIRKTAGRFYVTAEQFGDNHIQRADFATLRGAQIYVDGLKGAWL